MSEALTYYDFVRESESWTSAFGPAGLVQRRAFYALIKQEYGRLKYLKILKGIITKKDRPMIEVFTEYSVSSRHTDLVKIDFCSVWSEFVAGDQVAAHFMEHADTGFCLSFALRSRDDYCMVGKIHSTSIRS